MITFEHKKLDDLKIIARNDNDAIVGFIDFNPCADKNYYHEIKNHFIESSRKDSNLFIEMVKDAMLYFRFNGVKMLNLFMPNGFYENQKDHGVKITKDRDYHYINKPINVYIMGRDHFKSVMEMNNVTNDNVEEKDIFFISINNTNEPEYKPHFENKSNVLVQYFDDLDEDVEDKGLLFKAFTEEQGKELIAFIDKNKHKKQCILHCTAGISRSGAIGTFVSLYLGGDYDKFKRDNPYISPNAHVMSILNKLTR
jgi:predicted protein tyrosine phosphatase